MASLSQKSIAANIYKNLEFTCSAFFQTFSLGFLYCFCSVHLKLILLSKPILGGYYDIVDLSRPFFHPFLMNWRFALYLSVHEKRGACLIGYLCTSIFAAFIWVDEFHLWIISLSDLCES